MKPDYMNITEQQVQEDERIDAYLKCKMYSEEEIKFLEELEANPKMKARAIAIAKMIKTMKTAGIKRDAEAIDVLRRMKKKDIERVTHEVTSRPKVIRINNLIYGSIAAVCIALFVFAGFKYVDYRETMTLADNYSVYIANWNSQTYVKGGTNEAVKKELTSLFDKVKNGNVDDQTISRLSELWKQSTSESYNDYTEYASEIGYTLAIAYLRKGNKEKVQEILNRLQDFDLDSSQERIIRGLDNKL